MRNTTYFDYLDWRGDLTLEQDPFNEVDNLILSVLSYLDLSDLSNVKTLDFNKAIPLEQVLELLKSKTFFHNKYLMVGPDDSLCLLKQMVACKRFQELKLFAYEDTFDVKTEMQFAAITLLLPDGSLFLSFRGTDDTVIGWKEDFNMSFLSAVPAQKRATAYAHALAEAAPGQSLRLGGHSKGGNLAVWAAVHADRNVQDRILAAYSNDGPGFDKEVIQSIAFARMADRIHTFIPDSSIVGMLLEHEENYQIIASRNRSVQQHDPRSWLVCANHLVYLEERSAFGKHTDTVVKEWLDSLSPREREEFSDALFCIAGLGKNRTLQEMMEPGVIRAATCMIRNYAGFNVEKKRMITDIMKRLIKNVRVEWKESRHNTNSKISNGGIV